MENTKPLRLKDIRRLFSRGHVRRLEISIPADKNEEIDWYFDNDALSPCITIDVRFFIFFDIELLNVILYEEEAVRIIDKLTAKLGPDFFYQPSNARQKDPLRRLLQELVDAAEQEVNRQNQQKQNSTKQQDDSQQQNSNQQQGSEQEGQNSSNQNTQSNNTTQSNQRGDSNGVGEKSDKARNEMSQAGDDGKGESNARQGMPEPSSSDDSMRSTQKDDTGKRAAGPFNLSSGGNKRNQSELADQSDRVATDSNRIERPTEEEKSQTGSDSATTNRQRLAVTKRLEELMKRLEEDVSSDSIVETPPSSTPRNQFGGVTHAQNAIERIANHRASRKAAHKIKKHIEKIVKNTDINGQKQSPRLNAGVLVKQGLSNSYNMSRIRREELNLPVTILMCDVSGSCNAVATPTLAACYSISKELNDAYLIVHSNAYLDEEEEGTVSELIKKRFADRDIGLILSFADHDGEDDFKYLPQMCETFLWLDSGLGGIREENHSKYGNFNAPNLRYWRGVNNIQTAEIALRLIAKNPKRPKGI